MRSQIDQTDALSQKIKGYAVTTKQEAYELIQRAQSGDLEARNEMVLRNMRLVFSIAFWKRWQGSIRQDLVQAGVLGLIRAIEKFETERGFQFSTYARAWIHQAVARCFIEQRKLISIPRHLLLGKTDIDPETQRLLDQAMQLAPIFDSTDKAGSSFESSQPTATESALAHEQTEIVRKAIATLGSRKQEIIRRRFGIDQADSETLNVIATSLGVTRERVHQVEKKALEELGKILREQQS